MGRLIVPNPPLIEPVAAPLIPVSGIAAVSPVAGGLVCVTFYQEMPAVERPGEQSTTEFHTACRLLVPQHLVMPMSRTFFALLESAKIPLEGFEQGLH